MSATKRIYLRPGENELIETEIRVQPDVRSAIHGIVSDTQGRAVAEALVMLFEVGRDESLTSVTQCFTDELGQFTFGPLTAGQLYMLQVFKNAVKLRELEITVDNA